jgi:hypothetical protein
MALGFSIATIIVGTFMATSAFATCFISSCNAVTCSADAELLNSIDCTNIPSGGITLASGADLDLHGHDITCTSNCPSIAVTMTGTSSIVKNLVPGENKISGAFGTLVDCASKTGSRVTGIRLEQTSSGYGTNNCAKVDSNVLMGNLVGSLGIGTGGVANSDLIDNNYVQGWGIGIGVAGSHQMEIDDNVVVVHAITGTSVIGINANSSGATNVMNDTFFGDSGDLITFGGSVLCGTNFCDPSATACTTCISVGCCTPATAPMVGP